MTRVFFHFYSSISLFFLDGIDICFIAVEALLWQFANVPNIPRADLTVVVLISFARIVNSKIIYIPGYCLSRNAFDGLILYFI